MKKQQAPAPGGIVTSDAVHPNRLGRKWLIAGAGLVIIAGVVAGGYIGLQKAGLISKRTSQNSPAQVTVDPAQAIKNAQTELTNATTPQEKSAAYSHLGDAYLESKQTSDAVSAYSTAASTAQNSSDLAGQMLALGDLVGAYTQAGDTANEIKTLERLIPLLQQSSNPDDKRLAFRYQSLLDSLKGRQ